MIIVFILLITSKNWIVCNTIVVIVPLLLTYVYPNEKPPQENMLVYWRSQETKRRWRLRNNLNNLLLRSRRRLGADSPKASGLL